MVEAHGWSELSAGDKFAGYRIERRLGRGGMGILYLANEPGLERRVALKLIAPEAAADPVFSERFSEESRIAASIEHPNVVPIYAAGEADGVPFIAMRYVAGSDLSARLAREGRLGPAQATALIGQIGNGLDAIHAAGLVHRDVKPANVLLGGGDGADHAYITDFGVARNVATESGLTQTGRFVGTLDYVAPEQISGGPVDARVDVYALGCLLFKLLTGEVPYPREGEAARLYAHLNDPPPAPSLLVPELPMSLDDVVIRAMSKQPDDRYPSAGDLGRAAVAAAGGSRTVAPERTVARGAAATREAETVAIEDPPVPVAVASGRRRSLLLAAGTLLAVAAIAGALALGGSGGSGGDGSGVASTGRQGKPAAKQPQDPALSAPQLIAQGDAICRESQEKFASYREPFPNGESEPDVAYSRLLTGISGQAVKQFRRLDPPVGLAKPYKRYLSAQEQVARWDREALRAAEAEDATAYLAAREDRDETAEERRRLAEDVGFRECSGSEL